YVRGRFRHLQYAGLSGNRRRDARRTRQGSLRMSVLTALLGGRMPHSLLFDLDGTLVDSVPDLASAVDAMLADLALPLAGVDRVRPWVGTGATELVRRALAGSDLPAQTGA